MRSGRRAISGFASRELAWHVFACWVCVSGQEPESAPQPEDVRKFEVSMPDEQIGTLDGQGGGDVAATGADGDEPAAADPEQQGVDLEHNGQAELEGGDLMTVHQDADGGP